LKRSKIIIYQTISLIIPTLLLLIFGFRSKPEPEPLIPLPCNLEQIIEKGELHVVVDYNSINYFTYKGVPMGFQYEMLSALATEMGVSLKITVNNDLDEALIDLNRGGYDIFAKNFFVTKDRAEEIEFTEPVMFSRQILVQRNEASQGALADSLFIGTLLNLSGKTVVVRKNGVFAQRLENLSNELGVPITIVEDSIHDVEQLIEMVSKGLIDYTVSDENLAKVNTRLYRNLDISMPVSFNQKISWAVRKGAEEWKNFLDSWIVTFREGPEYQRIYSKYFETRSMPHMANSEFHSGWGGKISEYDGMIKTLATRFGLDWRLISAIVIQESQFNPSAESWMGAAGLMQLMPQTAAAYGVDSILDPQQNLMAGMKHLKSLDNSLIKNVPNIDERLKFVLAAYNVGLGHVLDARRLAKKYGRSDVIWDDNVEFFLLNKSNSEYYRDPVVKHGYCKGSEPVQYVEKVMVNYGHYLNLLPSDDPNSRLLARSTPPKSSR
jgi:membrane-bound lytic murein transglycosylase F